MRLLGCVLLCLGIAACSDAPKKDPEPKAAPAGATVSLKEMAAAFPKATLPWSISDTLLHRASDTASLPATEWTALLPDSLKATLSGEGKTRFTPLARLDGAQDGATYLALRTTNGSHHNALLYRFEGDRFTAAFPLLVPDADEATAQVSTVERSGAITLGITKKLPKEVVADGKDVYLYNKDLHTFALILTDPLEDKQDVGNPIDTFARTHPLAGDYVKGPRNFVSIRDARNPKELNFFVHFETGEDDNTCTGELKGTALLTSTKTAVYRQGGDPCVLELSFGNNSVTLREMEGCGSRRGVQCVFEGTFPRKKAVSPKSGAKKKSKK